MAVASRIVPTHSGTRDPVDLKSYAWARVNRTTSEALATNPDVPLWLRVFHAALLRLDRYGLAHFAHGELSELVAITDPTTGEVAPVHHVGSKGIRRCVELGLFTSESTPRRIGVALGVASVGGYDHLRLA